jgi:hypothetical protein
VVSVDKNKIRDEKSYNTVMYSILKFTSENVIPVKVRPG